MNVIERVKLVSDGILVSFSSGEVYYIAGQALHRHLEALAACRFVTEDPSPKEDQFHAMDKNGAMAAQALVRLLVGRDAAMSE